eukprot:GDKI01003358.1.p1 GENE.GDKI01003358.1~~GDKI01003358.1.p1  ORF type:complete len:214 (-),score=41.57 GDKI01003358.1:146-787(-)
MRRSLLSSFICGILFLLLAAAVNGASDVCLTNAFWSDDNMSCLSGLLPTATQLKTASSGTAVGLPYVDNSFALNCLCSSVKPLLENNNCCYQQLDSSGLLHTAQKSIIDTVCAMPCTCMQSLTTGPDALRYLSCLAAADGSQLELARCLCDGVTDGNGLKTMRTACCSDVSVGSYTGLKSFHLGDACAIQCPVAPKADANEIPPLAPIIERTE